MYRWPKRAVGHGRQPKKNLFPADVILATRGKELPGPQRSLIPLRRVLTVTSEMQSASSKRRAAIRDVQVIEFADGIGQSGIINKVRVADIQTDERVVENQIELTAVPLPLEFLCGTLPGHAGAYRRQPSQKQCHQARRLEHPRDCTFWRAVMTRLGAQ